jgi:toxin secretion/phage lysis holin
LRENIFKAAFAVACAGATAYFKVLLIPLAFLFGAMIADYITGMTKAWITKSLNSKAGIIGIVKKLCYLLVVCVGAAIDWIIQSVLSTAGIEFHAVFFVGLLVTVWLIINELISILENLAIIGVPLPVFLTKIIGKLRVAVEAKAESSDIDFTEQEE